LKRVLVAEGGPVEQEAVTEPPLDGIEVVSANPNWLELRVRCDMDAATRAVHFIRTVDGDLADPAMENVAVAFREILMNAVEHGGGNNPDLFVNVNFNRTSRALLFRVSDPGPGFSFAQLSHAAVSNPADSPAEHVMNRAERGMRPGGFGILMTRALVDELHYNEKGNEALLIKYLDR
jgi:anti-sigma regulatory factor (Ser/Thr protein kinase)